MKVVFACLAILSVIIVSANCKDFKCTDGVPYVENNCNGCSCQNGVLHCTFMACMHHNDGTNSCKLGATWKENCNQCWCTDSFGTVCTNYDC